MDISAAKGRLDVKLAAAFGVGLESKSGRSMLDPMVPVLPAVGS